MPISKEKKEERMKAAAKGIPGMAIIPTGGADDDEGSSVLQKDPNVELTKKQYEMGMAVPPYEGLLLQVTNFDHPMQCMGVINDMTMLDWLRSLGLPEPLYMTLKGESYNSKDGQIQIATTGFYGILRARAGLVYPGIDGMAFHPREQIFRNTRPAKDKEKTSKSLWQRLTGGGGE